MRMYMIIDVYVRHREDESESRDLSCMMQRWVLLNHPQMFNFSPIVFGIDKDSLDHVHVHNKAAVLCKAW